MLGPLQQPQLRKFRFERDSPPGGVAGSGSTRGQLFLQNPSASRLFCNQRAQVSDELGLALVRRQLLYSDQLSVSLIKAHHPPRFKDKSAII